MDWFAQLAPWVEQGSYFAVFSLLVLCGLGLPVPEEVTFILGGYVIGKIDGSLELMIGVALAGLLIGDTFLFFLGRRYGIQLLQNWPFRLIFTEQGLERGRQFFVRHGDKTVLMAGFVMGVRASVFFLSGTMGVGYFRFILLDGMRAVLTCPISIWLGYHFGPLAHEKLEPYKHWVFMILGVVIVGMIIKEYRAHRKG